MAKLNNYNGSVQLMSGITQTGGETYPLVEAHAVQTQEDGTRLDADLTTIKKSIPNIIDDLNSKNSKAGLSAKQGKVLNDKISDIIDCLSIQDTSDNHIVYRFDNSYKVDNFVTSTGGSCDSVYGVMASVSTTETINFIHDFSNDATPPDSYSHKYIKIKYRVNSTLEQEQFLSKISFSIDDPEVFADEDYVNFDIINDNNWHTAIIDMTAISNWTNNSVCSIRFEFDITVVSTETRILIDYIGFFTDLESANDYGNDYSSEIPVIKEQTKILNGKIDNITRYSDISLVDLNNQGKITFDEHNIPLDEMVITDKSINYHLLHNLNISYTGYAIIDAIVSSSVATGDTTCPTFKVDGVDYIFDVMTGEAHFEGYIKNGIQSFCSFGMWEFTNFKTIELEVMNTMDRVMDPYIYTFRTMREGAAFISASKDLDISYDGRYLSSKVTGTDTQIQHNFYIPLDASLYKYIKIRFKTKGDDNKHETNRLYFRNTEKTDDEWYQVEPENVSEDVDGWFITRFDLTKNENWSGEITSIRFDPLEDGTEEKYTFTMDYFGIFSTLTECTQFHGYSVVDSLETNSSYRALSARQGHRLNSNIESIRRSIIRAHTDDNFVVFNFDNTLKVNEFVGSKNKCNVYCRDNSLFMKSTGTDPWFIHDTINDDAIPDGRHPFIKIKYKSTDINTTTSKVWFTTETNPEFSEELSHSFDIIADGEWHYVIINLTEKIDPDDSLYTIKFEIPDNSVRNETLYIKYIGFFMTKESAEEYDDIINNLNSTSKTASLSAKQGKVLNDKINTIAESYPDISLIDLKEQGKLTADFDIESAFITDTSINGGSGTITINYTGYVIIDAIVTSPVDDYTYPTFYVDDVNYISDVHAGTAHFEGYIENGIVSFNTIGQWEFIRFKAIKNNMLAGEGKGSIVQKNGGVTNASGLIVSGSEATGKSAVAFGVRNIAAGDSSFVAGYRASAYQQGTAAFGSSTAGDENKQKIFEEVLSIAAEIRRSGEGYQDDPTLSDEEFLYCPGQYSDPNNPSEVIDVYPNYNACLNKYNNRHPEAELDPDEFPYTEFQKLKFSFSFAAGEGNQSIGRSSSTLGYGNNTYGKYATAIGVYNTVNGDGSFSAGEQNTVNSIRSAVFGFMNTMDGEASFISGNKNTITSIYSSAFGENNNISGNASFAAGHQNTITSTYATAVGKYNKVNGSESFASGSENTVDGQYSFATGYGNVITSNSSFAAGNGHSINTPFCSAFGKHSKIEDGMLFAIGYGTSDNKKNVFSVDKFGKTITNEITANKLIASNTDPVVEPYIYTFENLRKVKQFVTDVDDLTYECNNMSLYCTTTGDNKDVKIFHEFDTPLIGSEFKYIKIKFRTSVTENHKEAIMYFTTVDETNATSGYVKGTYTDLNNGWYTAIFDMSSNGKWDTKNINDANIKKLRFDPLPNNKTNILKGTVYELEYLGIFATEDEANTYTGYNHNQIKNINMNIEYIYWDELPEGNIYALFHDDITATSNGTISLSQSATDAQYEELINSGIRIVGQVNGMITLKSINKPTIDIPITLTLTD